MNNLIKLKGRFQQAPNNSKSRGSKEMYAKSKVDIEFLENRIRELESIKEYFSRQDLIQGNLVSIEYVKLVAKSNRISKIFSTSSHPSNATVVGANFNENNTHTITHFINEELLNSNIQKLKSITVILNDHFSGSLLSEEFNTKENKIKFNFISKDVHSITKSDFIGIIADLSYIKSFGILTYDDEIVEQNKLVSFYNVKVKLKDLLFEIFNENFSPDKIMGDLVLLSKEEITIIKNKAPYLIAMSIEDFNSLDYDEVMKLEIQKLNEIEFEKIPDPTIEPTIGVIDTLFDESVYFSEWVEFHNEIDPNIPLDPKDYDHGTQVASIIVDGHRINPDLDDGCGNFKVRHFGVSLHAGYTESIILKKIENIISKNLDIKVWNISLGSKNEVNRSYVSPISEKLDRLQYKYDLIFVIAGTNKRNSKTRIKVGSPADSINSVVVNSVDYITKMPADYSREGYVLDFFIKPDVSYYGGTKSKPINVCGPLGLKFVEGTSYASPWIARKLSYLIDVLGFEREIAKAMIIDSAIGWNIRDDDYLKKIGNGVVPISISEIIQTKKDEIKFVLSGVSEKYNTYNYSIPVPMDKDKYPYYAKATLSYFPNTSRLQGVDYTNTELNLIFGRMNNKNKISPINRNLQGEEGEKILEADARRWFRKWDTVKHIKDHVPNLVAKKMPRKSYVNKLWGIELRTVERLTKIDGENIKFGIVVTLKEMNGVNRYDDFIRLCMLHGWIVEEIKVDNKIDIYSKLSQDIDFE